MDKENTSTCAEEYKLLVMAMMLMAGRSNLLRQNLMDMGSAVIRLSHLPATAIVANHNSNYFCYQYVTTHACHNAATNRA
jgi:hypothetical protein